MSQNSITKIPSASKMLSGLRSFGYSFETAVADIIDNSISAHAKKIWVEGKINNNDPYLFVLDNGDGISEELLPSAMSFGSDSLHDGSDNYDLGRFGLGLNTASLSQCRRFYVVSKINDKMVGAFWDCDILEETNEWLLNFCNEEQLKTLPGYKDLVKLTSGTLVIWKNFDKIKNTTNDLESSFYDRLSSAKDHCALVFHRFYDEIEIYFNRDRVEKRDPFLENFDNGQWSGEKVIPFENQEIKYQAFVLPYIKNMTDEQKSLIGGIGTIKKEQGFYIYRNRRLIIKGTWFRMNTKTKFNELARIRVDIPSSLDNIWMLDVKKTSASIPDNLKEKLYAAINDATFKSKRTIVYPGEREYSKNKNKIWSRIKTRDNKIIYKLNEQFPLLVAIKEKLGDDVPLFDELLKLVEEYLPKERLTIDIEENLLEEDKQDDEEAKNKLITVLSLFPKEKRAEQLELLIKYENFISLAKYKDEILKEVTK